MKVGPSESAFKEQAPNHPKLLRSRAVVVSVGGKAMGRYPRQVRNRETNESEPPLTRRKTPIVVETRSVRLSWDKPVGHLITGQAAAGVEEA